MTWPTPRICNSYCASHAAGCHSASYDHNNSRVQQGVSVFTPDGRKRLGAGVEVPQRQLPVVATAQQAHETIHLLPLVCPVSHFKLPP